MYRRGGTKFWFQGMRNCYLAVAERNLLLPSSLTSRLLNRSPIGGIATGHPDDWTIEQLREPAQRIADRIQADLLLTPSCRIASAIDMPYPCRISACRSMLTISSRLLRVLAIVGPSRSKT